jgi:hypothetical protein
MADWYCSSVAYNALPVWQPNTPYTVGQIIRPTAPALNYMHAHRCSIAGTSAPTEPSWGFTGNNTSGSATFQNVSGLAAYGWSAAAGSSYALTYIGARMVGGDRLFMSSDHVENWGDYISGSNTNPNLLFQCISVNRAGSVPPVAADYLSGATVNVAGNGTELRFEAPQPILFRGIIFNINGVSSSAQRVRWTLSYGSKSLTFRDCSFIFTNNNAGNYIYNGGYATKVVFDNTPVTFSNAAQSFLTNSNMITDFQWINTANAVQGVMPTALFTAGGQNASLYAALRGVDLSMITGTLNNDAGYNAETKLLLDGCKIAPAVARYAATQTGMSEVELVRCFDGTNVVNEKHAAAGAVTFDRSVTMVGGANDGSLYSLKMVSTVKCDIEGMALEAFWLDVDNTVVGSPKTATVEIISSTTLTSYDIRLALQYMGTVGSSIVTTGNSLANLMAPAVNLPTSGVTWNNPPGTPIKQMLQVTFTPQVAGRVRGLVRLGKPSATVWINPQVTIT